MREAPGGAFSLPGESREQHGVPWELQEAFLGDVALGLVAAEKKRERSSGSHTRIGEDGGTTRHVLSRLLRLYRL